MAYSINRLIAERMETEIQLNEQLLIANGGRRKIYQHPDDNNKCVKIAIPHDLQVRKRISKWYKKLKPIFCFDENETDRKAYDLLKKKPDVIYRHIPRFYGKVKTNLGEGIVTQLIRSADGEVAVQLKDYIKENGVSEVLEQRLAELIEFTEENVVITRQLKLFNLCVQKGPTGEIQRIYIIDGFGNSDFLPFSNWSTALGKRKIKRKNQRFVTELQRKFPGKFNNLVM
jgi:hypothetical protein